MGACFEKNHLSMVTEFMPHGTLHSVLHNSKFHLDWSQRITMLKDICCGMAFLHGADPPNFHRDLKSPNILPDSDFRLKVADFGLASIRESDRKGFPPPVLFLLDLSNLRKKQTWARSLS